MRALNAVAVFALVIAAFVFRAPLHTFVLQTYHLVLPCRSPITYSIGAVDPRFNLSPSALRDALASAESVWEKASGRDLYAYASTTGMVTVNLVYDERQATTETLSSLGLSIENDLASYQAAKERYDSLYTKYRSDAAAFEAASDRFEKRVAAYQAEVQKWNARGGAPRDTYAALEREKQAIAEEQVRLNATAEQVNREAREVNALVSTTNRLAKTVNTVAAEYNASGRQEEFEEAVFTSQPAREEINVYEFDSTSRLVRVLAHEFGHALGMEHVDDAAAIMYRLNQSKQSIPTTADLSELRRVCRVS